jgi:hypothetical protein
MDELLMLHGVVRWCSDCRAETIFVPACGDEASERDGVDLDGCLCCTACDAAVYVFAA